MKKSVVCGCGIMLAAFAIGCGGGSSTPDGAVKEMINLINEQASLLEGKADKAKIDAVKAREEALKKKMDAFPKDQLAAAMEKHKDEVVKATMRLMKAGFGGLFEKMKDFKMPDFKMPNP